MPTFTATLFADASWAETEITAPTANEALQEARRLFNDEPERLPFNRYDDEGELREVEIADDNNDIVAGWDSPGKRYAIHGGAIVGAARLVLARWETGDLADAVRQLQAAVDAFDPSERG